MTLASLRFSDVQIRQFCQRYHIRRLSFFGSVVREDFGPQSDVDILVEFKEGHTPGFSFFQIEAELSGLLKHKVDLQTPNFLSADIRRSIASDLVTVYEQT